MARQKITSKKPISQPGDEDVKDDTHSKLVQPAPPHVDASEFDESHDDDEEEDSGVDEEGLEKLMNDDDVDSIDQDAIPRRKIQVDNKVRPFPLSSPASSSYIMGRSHSNAYGTPSNSTNPFRGPRL